MIDDYLQSARIACFSMEVALRGDIPANADDPGILAGDTVRWADIELPLVTLTLARREGFFRQSQAPAGEQRENRYSPA
jgi:starch phosphorylase